MPAVTVAVAGPSGTMGHAGVTLSATVHDDGLSGAAPPERPLRVWAALKKHIIRERQRKKEEHEAEVEEERLRKEREARERQDVMTLGETREQIQQLEQKISKLKEEKHQLFLMLKKVLNEDDNRKKQFKDSNEGMVNMDELLEVDVGHTKIFLPPNMRPKYSSQVNQHMGRPPLSAHVLNKVYHGGGGIKRGRSPSPPYAQPQTGPHSGSPYMHQSHHKQQHISPYQGPTHKIEDGRNREMARAVLWNKSLQYGSSGGGSSFYAMPQTEQRTTPMLYATPIYHHHVQQHHTPPKQVHSQSHSPYHMEVKHEMKKDNSVVMGLGEPHQPAYLTQPPPPGISSAGSAASVPSSPVANVRHVNQQQYPGPPTRHQSLGPLQHGNVQNPKPGSITTGYPVRQQNPPVQNLNMYSNIHRY